MAQISLAVGILSLVVSGVILILSVLLLGQLKKLDKRRQSFLSSDRKLKSRTAQKIEEEVEKQISGALSRLSTTIEAESKKQLGVIVDEASKQARELAAFAAEQQNAIAKETQYLVANDLVKVRAELDDYKQKKLQEINEKINSIILATSREVLGKTIDVGTHEDLVMKALERAKVDNLFANA